MSRDDFSKFMSSVRFTYDAYSLSITYDFLIFNIHRKIKFTKETLQ